MLCRNAVFLGDRKFLITVKFRLHQVGGGVDGEGEEENSAITIRVKDQGGDEMLFKVKKDTKMQKIFDAYSQRRGVQASVLRFMLDGQRIEGILAISEYSSSIKLED